MIRTLAMFLGDLIDPRRPEMREKAARAEGFGQGLKAGIRIGRNSAQEELLGEPMQDSVLRLQVYANGGAGE